MQPRHEQACVCSSVSGFRGDERLINNPAASSSSPRITLPYLGLLGDADRNITVGHVGPLGHLAVAKAVITLQISNLVKHTSNPFFSSLGDVLLLQLCRFTKQLLNNETAFGVLLMQLHYTCDSFPCDGNLSYQTHRCSCVSTYF